MLESGIERDFTTYVKENGGMCIKQNPNWYRGIPDRLIVKCGRCIFIELKRPGEKPTPLQHKRLANIKVHGTPAYWCDTLEQAKELYDLHFK